jgi:hypothetical protein
MQARIDLHGKLYMSGIGRRGGRNRKQGPRFKIVMQRSRTETPWVLLRGNPAGPWAWLESGTQPHVVGAGKGETRLSLYSRLDTGKTYAIHSARAGNKARGTKQRIQSKFRNMAVNGEVRQGPWMVGGSPAKHTFSDAVNAVPVPEIVNKHMLLYIGKKFSGSGL